jgi:hypothetical protein
MDQFDPGTNEYNVTGEVATVTVVDVTGGYGMALL